VRAASLPEAAPSTLTAPLVWRCIPPVRLSLNFALRVGTKPVD